MNFTRIADLLRQRAALDSELAEAFEALATDVKPRRRSCPDPTMDPPPGAKEAVRRKLRRKGVLV